MPTSPATTANEDTSRACSARYHCSNAEPPPTVISSHQAAGFFIGAGSLAKPPWTTAANQAGCASYGCSHGDAPCAPAPRRVRGERAPGIALHSDGASTRSTPRGRNASSLTAASVRRTSSSTSAPAAAPSRGRSSRRARASSPSSCIAVEPTRSDATSVGTRWSCGATSRRSGSLVAGSGSSPTRRTR